MAAARQSRGSKPAAKTRAKAGSPTGARAGVKARAAVPVPRSEPARSSAPVGARRSTATRPPGAPVAGSQSGRPAAAASRPAASGPANSGRAASGPPPLEAAAAAAHGLAASALAATGAMPAALPAWSIDPARIVALQNDYTARLQQLWADFMSPDAAAPKLSDKRFAGSAWTEQKPFAWNAALYLLNADFMQKMAESVDRTARQVRDRIRFYTQQFLDALSPANFLDDQPRGSAQAARHPAARACARPDREFPGRPGPGPHLADRRTGVRGRPQRGHSPGGVVFRNDIIELIQYAPAPTRWANGLCCWCRRSSTSSTSSTCSPTTRSSHTPCPAGTRCSWCRGAIRARSGTLTWDDYLHGAGRGDRAVSRRSPAPARINALGFCVGGTILAARWRRWPTRASSRSSP